MSLSGQFDPPSLPDWVIDRAEELMDELTALGYDPDLEYCIEQVLADYNDAYTDYMGGIE